MSNVTRTIRRNKARLLIGEYEARRTKKKKTALRIIPGKSKVLSQFWNKLQIDRYGYWPWRKNRVACDPKQRGIAVLFPVQFAGKTQKGKA